MSLFVSPKHTRHRGRLARTITVLFPHSGKVEPTGLGGGSYPPVGALLIAGNAWLSGQGVNVYSNGGDGAGGYYQCVELINRLITTRGWSPSIYGNANQLYYNASTAYFDKHSNGSGYQPVPGDIVVWGGGSGGDGHVSVVEANNGGLLTVVEQNSSPSGYGTNPISASGNITPTAYGYYVEGFLHAHANHMTELTGGGAGPGTPAPSPPAATNTMQGMAAGTSPSVAVSPNGSWRAAFEANNDALYVFDSTYGAVNQGQGMMPGTSPAITAIPGGGFEMAFQANTGELVLFGDGVDINTHQGMAPGTSPSIAYSANGAYRVAFQANNNGLYVFDSTNGAVNEGQGMAPGTSPAITAIPGGGFEMAFQANTGELVLFGDGIDRNTHQGMAAGTNPSVAWSSNGSYRAAFEANNNSLYVFDSTNGAVNEGQGMMPGTSPAIAAMPGAGFEMAFQANTGELVLYGDGVNVNTHQGMAATSNPSITPQGPGFRAAFQANTGALFQYTH